MSKIIFWDSKELHPLEVKRPCECGCDFRDGDMGVGYLIGSLVVGKGFTVWLGTEEQYQKICGCLGQEVEPSNNYEDWVIE